MTRGEWRNRLAQALANLIISRLATMDYLSAQYEVNRLGREEYRRRRAKDQ